MPLSVTFAFSPSEKQNAASVRFMPNGTVELWRQRATYPRLEVTHTGESYEAETVGENYLLWSVVYDSGEEVARCPRCPPGHMMGWKRRQPPTKIVEYGEHVPGFLPTDGVSYRTHVNTKYFNPDAHRSHAAGAAAAAAASAAGAAAAGESAASKRRKGAGDDDVFPVVKYRDVAGDGSRQFKLFLACNSHFHGHHLFHVKVQLVELNSLGAVIRAETAYSPRIKVVSKFLTKKGTKALPEAEVRELLSMQTMRKRRKLSALHTAPDGQLMGLLEPFPSPSARRRKVPIEMADLQAEQERRLAEEDAAAAAAAGGAAPMTGSMSSMAEAGPAGFAARFGGAPPPLFPTLAAHAAPAASTHEHWFSDPMLAEVGGGLLMRSPLPALFPMAVSPGGEPGTHTSPLDAGYLALSTPNSDAMAVSAHPLGGHADGRAHASASTSTSMQMAPSGVIAAPVPPSPAVGGGANRGVGMGAGAGAGAGGSSGAGVDATGSAAADHLRRRRALVSALVSLSPADKYQLLEDACTIDPVLWNVMRAFVAENAQPIDDDGDSS